LQDEQTQYQHLQFVETEFFGNAMILDGIIQLTERDNMGYHEMIVHVRCLQWDSRSACLLSAAEMAARCSKF
jgi:spermidine synthase